MASSQSYPSFSLCNLSGKIFFFKRCFSFTVCSDTFTNEKTKIEDQIRRGKEQYEEILQRAVAAEVSQAWAAEGRVGEEAWHTGGGLGLLCADISCSTTALPGAEAGVLSLEQPLSSPAASSLLALTL